MLDIYKASAGSGKTYTLALIYIDLIIDDFSKYSNILAVTFTNKSTAEMKSRIVKNLYALAEPSDKNHNDLIKAQKEYRASHNKPAVNDMEIVHACRNALVLLLNNYSQFNISTIDKFVQKIIRSFAFENKLSADYRVNIDADQTKTEMVDMLMANMETDHSLQNWLTRLMTETMDEGQGWNIEDMLSPIAKSLLQGHDLQAVDRATLEQSRKNNAATLQNLLKPIASGISSLISELDNMGLTNETQFFGKSKSNTFKLASAVRNSGKSPLDLLTDKAQYSTIIGYIKKIFGNKIQIVADTKINESNLIAIANALISTCNINDRAIQTIKLLDSKFYALGIINDLKQNLSTIEHEQHMQMLGGANKLLKDLIGSAPIPFIYEKAGSRFDNIMIDEFQDTSKVQWENFKPLIENSLANDKMCLLVGDVKQAIYRWRNSDWKLLSETVYKDNDINNYISDNNLGTNWRSFRNIIEFNNDLFPVLAKNAIDYMMPRLDGDQASFVMLTIIADIYANGRQLVSPSRSDNELGYVELNIMDDAAEAIELKYKQMVDTINYLISKGYNYSDICILIRNNDEATDIVKVLSAEGISVLSNQALFVLEAPAIKALMSILRYTLDDTDEPALAHSIAVLTDSPAETLYDTWRSDSKREYANKLACLKGLGLLELVYKAINILPEDIRQRDYIFLEAFIERTRAYVDTQSASLKDFLDYIENHKKNLVIQAPEGQNAVNITSIHKSKGLEFPIVLIPNCDWSLFRKGTNEIWCDLTNEPLSPLNTIELPFSKVKGTNMSDQYYNEATQTIVDNMNLLYVAFTRAKEGLFVWCNNVETKKEKALTSVTVGDLLKESLDKKTEIEFNDDGAPRQLSITLDTDNIDAIQWPTGELDDDGNEVFEEIPVIKYHRGDINSLSGKGAVISNNSGNDNLSDVTFDKDISSRLNIVEESEQDKRKEGKAKHHIMENIITSADLDKAVRQAIIDGDIDKAEADSFCSWFNEGLKNDIIASWFNGSYRVLNETIFLTPADGTKELRTDRLMINDNGEVIIVDFKFAEKKSAYNNQVKTYMEQVRMAGFNNVKGYLWYDTDNMPTPVEP